MRSLLLAASFLPLVAVAQITPRPVPRPTPLPTPTPRLPVDLPLTVRVDDAYIACNLLQIHIAREDAWRPVYADLGAEADDLDAYARDLQTATEQVCAGESGSAAYAATILRIERFRSGVDEGTAARLAVPVESASRFRLGALYALDEAFWEGCLSPHESMGLIMGRMPLTPDLGIGMEIQPATAALGQCTGGGGSTGGSGSGLPMPSVQVGQGLAAAQSCMQELVSQASTCDSPVGLSQTEARGRIEAAESVCASGGGDCVRTEEATDTGTRTTITYAGDDGSATTLVFEEKGGEVTSLSLTQVYREGRTEHRVSHSFSVDPTPREVGPSPASALPQSAPVVTQTMDPTTWYVLKVTERLLGLDDNTLAPESFYRVNQPGPRGTLQCEAYAGGSSQPVGILRSSAASTPGSGVGPGVPGLINSNDVIAYCLCQGGSLGRQLAGSMGFGCPSEASEYARRMACFESNPVAQPIPDECVGFAEEAGGTDLSAMCDATIQCPEGSAATGTVISGRLSCGCGRTGTGSGGTGSGRPPGCATVSCPPPGSPMPSGSERCCAPAGIPTLTPRAEAIRALRLPVLRPDVLRLPSRQLPRREE